MTARVLLPLLAAALFAVGCGAKSDSPAPTEGSGQSSAAKKLRIAVIPKGSTHEFWKSVKAGADEAAAELGDVEVIWKGPQKENDREDQIKVVEDFVTQKVDGIVLAPLDDTALRLPVSDAQAAEIPVLIIDSGLKEVDTVSFVATDNFAAGKKGGEQLVKSLGDGPKKVILLRYQEGSASTREREEGFLEALKAASNVTIISQEQYAGATVETAQQAAENLLQRFPEFDGVACPNESSTFGMLLALQGAGKAGKVKFVGFDVTEKLLDAIKAGQIDGLVIQNPNRMGYLGVKHLVDHIKKQNVEKRIDTGSVLVTKDNLTDPEVSTVIAPPKS